MLLLLTFYWYVDINIVVIFPSMLMCVWVGLELALLSRVSSWMIVAIVVNVVNGVADAAVAAADGDDGDSDDGWVVAVHDAGMTAPADAVDIVVVDTAAVAAPLLLLSTLL